MHERDKTLTADFWTQNRCALASARVLESRLPNVYVGFSTDLVLGCISRILHGSIVACRVVSSASLRARSTPCRGGQFTTPGSYNFNKRVVAVFENAYRMNLYERKRVRIEVGLHQIDGNKT
jgi:hypothetical protein